jgi:type I restriction enzyme M protein
LSRESKVEEELYRVMKNVLEKSKYTIEGVRFIDVEPQKKADSGRADLVVIIHPSKVLLVIECKKKVGAQAPRAFKQFDPMSSLVIDQALNYAVHLGAEVFATTNGNVFALFDMPRKGEGFRIDTNRLFIKEASVTEEMALQLLTLAARVHIGAKIEKTPLDWAFIIRLRSFVEYLSIQLVSPIMAKLRDEPAFKARFEAFTKLVGTGTPKAYAREAAYILMNKIIFYKTLERSYPSLRKLVPIKSQDPKKYGETLRKCFTEAILATDDFEPVFSTGIYDDAPFPDDSDFLAEIDAFIEEMGKYRLEEIGSDVLGPVFENLIKDEERHQLGQFYTPPQIAELIVRWGVRAPSDTILDPAVGCGTFLVKAYQILAKLKPLRSNATHREILSQVFAVDINPFPAQLTAVNLSMRDVQHPTSEMNIVVDDFFNISPKTPVFSPFAVKSAEGQKKRKIVIPDIDVVVANPPYTRYVEISPQTRKSIQAAIGQTLALYGLHGGIRGAVTEIGIYIYFVVYSAAFLKDGGRLGMIVSNGWLQTEYGMAFSKYLLDNFQIRAVIDFSTRLFEVPLIATCVILLEKRAAREERENNDVLFAYVSGKKTTVNHLLDLIEGSTSALKGVMTRRVRQSELTVVQKWIQVMFNPDAIEEAMRKSPLVVPMKELFQPLRGNTNWSKYAFEKTLRPNVGPGEFFELDKGTISKWGLEKYAHPAITSIRKSKFFTFDKKDWSATASAGGKAYYFLCHAPKSKLATGPAEYIKWGETRCRTTIRETRGGGEICSQTWICKEREKAKVARRFCGWYDLGGVIPAPIFAVRHGWYKTRFSVSNFNVAMYDAAIALIPKTRLTTTQIDALAAYLNSNFCQLYIETHGRATSGGVIGLETKVAETIPILDVRKVEAEKVQHLAKLFRNLEKKTRQIGGADTLEHVESLTPEIEEIDSYVGKLLDLEGTDISSAESLVRSLVQRRTSRVREAKPESIVGEDAPKLKLPKKSVRSRSDTLSVPLDRWT